MSEKKQATSGIVGRAIGIRSFAGATAATLIATSLTAVAADLPARPAYQAPAMVAPVMLCARSALPTAIVPGLRGTWPPGLSRSVTQTMFGLTTNG